MVLFRRFLHRMIIWRQFACQVRVTVGSSGLFVGFCVTSLMLINSLVCWFDSLINLIFLHFKVSFASCSAHILLTAVSHPFGVSSMFDGQVELSYLSLMYLLMYCYKQSVGFLPTLFIVVWKVEDMVILLWVLMTLLPLNLDIKKQLVFCSRSSRSLAEVRLCSWLDHKEDVPLVVFMYLIFTRMPCESYRRQLRSLLLCLCYVFRALSNSLVCCLHT